jgi:hypothetical protein
MVNGCLQTLSRRYVGDQVLQLFKETGVKKTESLISIIEGLLTEYSNDIATRSESPSLIGKIYSQAKERYEMKSKSQV